MIRYKVNFFKKWNCEMAYILGFIFADGNIIVTKRNTKYISIYTADKNLLILIKKIMNLNQKVSECRRNNGKVYRIQIGSKIYFDDLINLGLLVNKARRLILPNIPKKFIPDFIRGYFDGDGNVWMGYINKRRKRPTLVLQVAFTSVSHIFLEELRIILNKNKLRGSIYNIKDKNCSRLQYSTMDALKLFKIMYNSDSSLYLGRKKRVFIDFLKMRP